MYMQEYARGFYNSAAWRKVTELCKAKARGLCEKCGGIGKVTHHIKHITEDSVNDVSVTLAEDNLIYLCQDCHAAVHSNTVSTRDDVKFNSSGELEKIF